MKLNAVKLAGLAAASAVVLVGCSSGSSGPNAAVISVSTAVPPSVAISAAPAQSEPAAPSIAASSTTASGAVPIGSAQTATLGELELTATAHGLKTVPPSEFSFVGEGNEYTGLDVEVCGNFAGTVTSKRWTLLDSTNGRYRPETITSQDLAPEYPSSEEPLAADECIRGWIMFETVVAQPITGVRYETGDSSVLLKWDVPEDQG